MRRRPCSAALDETAAPEADEVGAAIDPELEAWIAAINQSARALPNGHAGDGADCVLYTLEPAQRLWRDLGLDPAAGGEHLPCPPAAGRRVRPRAPTGDVEPGGRGPGQLRRHGRSGDRAPARRAETRRPSGWARPATATRCGGCSRPGAATGAARQSRRCATSVPRAGRFGWHFDSEGQQHVVCEVDEPATTWSWSASASPGTST